MPLASHHPTKQERVYRALRERILSGVYGPGYRVVIDTLAEEFEMSALPVREAIRRLEAEGLVVYRPNAGAQVAPADPAAFEQEMTVLAVLEGYATALAAPAIGPEQIEELTAINERMVAAMQEMDSLAFGRLNHEFHAAIIARCPNRSLVAMIEAVGRRLDAIRRTVFVQIPYRGATSVAEHRALVALLAAHGSPETIERAAREHKLATVATFHDRAQGREPDAGAA